MNIDPNIPNSGAINSGAINSGALNPSAAGPGPVPGLPVPAHSNIQFRYEDCATISFLPANPILRRWFLLSEAAMKARRFFSCV